MRVRLYLHQGSETLVFVVPGMVAHKSPTQHAFDSDTLWFADYLAYATFQNIQDNPGHPGHLVIGTEKRRS
jgi:hypothetical protein